MKTPDIVVRGKDNGEGMVIHYQTAKGTSIFGLAMPNIYGNTDWDLGPTWCYLIIGPKITLIDTGRFGNFEFFKDLLKSVDKKLSDIDRIIITHSHEDHDGNLTEILSAAQAELWAHRIYSQMISYYPHIIDGAVHPDLPGSCRLCTMPEEFYKNCIPYHKKRSELNIDFAINDNETLPDDSLSFISTPGHSPDSICIVLEDDVIFTGDTLLPDITPHPSQASAFEVNRQILPEEYRQSNVSYGLLNYIKSLNNIMCLSSQPFQATFPAHRLFYNGRFNIISSSSQRAKEIIRFHIDRCRDILKIVNNKPTGLDYIVERHFPPSMLKGMGKLMASDEVMAHLELMEACGDVRVDKKKQYVVEPTGSHNFVDSMAAYLQC
jgi:glyoxylase-like metal-dependent hydrolase (beta-lactamase superfamily II)